MVQLLGWKERPLEEEANLLTLGTSAYFLEFRRVTMGGWKKEGGGKPHEWHPSQKGVLDPPSYGTFSTPLRCQRSVFPVQKSTTEQTRSSFRGVQTFSGERVLWYVFLPPYVLHPPISRPNKVPEGHHPRAQPSVRLSEEICLSEGSAGVCQRALRGLSEGSAGPVSAVFCMAPLGAQN